MQYTQRPLFCCVVHFAFNTFLSIAYPLIELATLELSELTVCQLIQIVSLRTYYLIAPSDDRLSVVNAF